MPLWGCRRIEWLGGRLWDKISRRVQLFAFFSCMLNLSIDTRDNFPDRELDCTLHIP